MGARGVTQKTDGYIVQGKTYCPLDIALDVSHVVIAIGLAMFLQLSYWDKNAVETVHVWETGK